MIKNYHLYFTGKVQGVWFRRTARNYAKDIGLKGWVKNLEDGRVEMMAEGPVNQLDLLLAQLDLDFEITHTEKEVSEVTEAFKDFSIAY